MSFFNNFDSLGGFFFPYITGGVRANTIHYIANNQVIADGELVLMDAGCELHGYTSDLTRTWPVNGEFLCVHTCVKSVCMHNIKFDVLMFVDDISLFLFTQIIGINS